MSTPAEDSVDKDDKLRADAQNKQAQIEMYLASWQDMKEQSRHFDGVRTQACAIMIAAVGVNLAFIAENGPQQVDVSAGILIAILGLLGFAMNEVYTARIVERNIQSETAWKHLKSIIGITGGIA